MRKTFKIDLRLMCVLMVVLLASMGVGITRLAAQAATATLQGTVTDASGAAVPDVKISVKNTGTGAAQDGASNSQGRYTLPNLSVGIYDVEASKTGFQSAVRRGVTLNVGAEVLLDFSIQVGQQTQSVTVEGTATTVETTEAAVGNLTDQRQMRDLPLNGRNFEQLIQITPGVVVMSGNSFLTSGFQGRAPQYSIAGSRPTGQAILLDDENLQNYWNKGMGSVAGTSLGVEAIGEFQTLTNTYGAQFGGNGAVINAVSKSGTNAFHGSAYEFFRNNKLDAWDTFAKIPTTPSQPAYRQNQFGGSVGGPIKKDKTFFFVNYEGIRRTKGDVKTGRVPGCNLTAFAAACQPGPNAINPNAIRAALATYPDATTVVNGQPLAVSVANEAAQENYVLGRFDYNISNKDSIFARYISDKSNFLDPFGGGAFAGGPIPFWPEQDYSHMQFATVEWRRIITPTLVNVARFSYSRPGTNEFTTNPVGRGVQNGGDPLQFFPGAGRQTGIVTITGLAGIGGALQLPFNTTQNRYTEADDIIWTHGAHNMKFGASVSRLQSNTFMPFFQGGNWSYTSLSQFVAGLPFFNPPGTPQGCAPFTPGCVAIPNVVLYTPLGSYPNRDYRSIDFFPYFQDDWKVSTKLTLNLGLRWEFTSNPKEQHNALYYVPDIANANPNSKPPFWVNLQHPMLDNPAWKNFNPRFGLAYDPFGNHKTSIRGGFGMFHELISVQNYSPAFWAAYPWPITVGIGSPYPIIPTGGIIIQTPSAFPGWDVHVNNTPYVMQYNLNVQHQLASSTVLTVGYVGSHGVHLFTGQEENPPLVCTTAQGPGCAVPGGMPGSAGSYPAGFTLFGPGGAGGYLGSGLPGAVTGNVRLNNNLGTFPNLKSSSTSRYNSMLIDLNRRFSHNVQAQVSYNLSHCIDDGGYLGSFNTASTGNVTNPYNRSWDKAACSHDVQHVFKVNGLLALPFKGNKLVEGWQISGIMSATSGLVYNIADGYDEVFGGSTPNNLTPRPHYVAGCNINEGASINQWFNPNCFTLQAPGTFGNLGRNTGRGPHLTNVDLAFLKDTKLNERLNLQFRAEMFNIFNHPNYGLPSAGLGGGAQLFTGGGILRNTGDLSTYTGRDGSAPTISSLAGTPRQIQFALKLTF
jgi:hypothetical protein